MLALLCKRFGDIDDLEITTINRRLLAPNEVRVRMHYVALSFADVLIVRGQYQVKPPLPFSPGTSGAGVVVEVGAAVKAVSVGDRVSVGHGYGALAEELVTEVDRVDILTNSISLADAAALRIGHATALFALETRARLASGETLAVTGAAGGVGLAAVQIGKVLGARVIGCVSDDSKAGLVRAHGADFIIDSGKEDLRSSLRRLTEHDGVDVIVDVVGEPHFRTLLGSLNFGGRLVVVGFVGGIPKLTMNLPLLKNCTIMGAYLGGWSTQRPKDARALYERLHGFAARGSVRAHVSDTLPLSRAKEGLRRIASRHAVGRILISIGS